MEKELSSAQQEELLGTLENRFKENMHRHKKRYWKFVKEKLDAQPRKLVSLYEMENTGGEPDVVNYDPKTKEFIFMDCSKESPKGRRSLCYDREGLESRKDYPPKNTAIDMAKEMGVELLTEDQYRYLQSLGDFDTKTSSWLKTPDEIRNLRGAIFGDFRYNHTFIYHNGAQSYYGSRGFRASICV